MKTWKLTVNEEELKCLINNAAGKIYSDPTPENSMRLHDLVKRLNKDTPDIETEDKQQAQPVAQTAPAAAPATW